MIKAGSPGLRAVLIEAAHRLMRYDDRWKALTASLVGRGKRKSVAAEAVADRRARWLHHETGSVAQPA